MILDDKKLSDFYYDLSARIMLATLLFVTEEIAKVDTNFQNLIKNESLIVQWTIEEGPSSYFEIDNGKITCIRDQKHPQPDIIISINNSKTAVKVLKGSLKTIKEENEAGNVLISGEESKIEEFNPILEKIEEYLISLRE